MNFNEPVLKQGTPKWQHIANHCLRLPTDNLAVIFRKLYWNPTVHMYLQKEQCARKTWARCANVLLTGEEKRKTCNRHLKSFQKRWITLKNAWLPQHFMLWNRSNKPINTWLVSGCEQKAFRLYFSWTRRTLSEKPKALLQRFCH